MSSGGSPYRRHRNDVESGGAGSGGFEDYESASNPFYIVNTKSASVDRLKRWRQAALVLNVSRRFRYTLDLKKEEEKKQIIAKIRTHAQVIRAAYLFQAAGVQSNELEEGGTTKKDDSGGAKKDGNDVCGKHEKATTSKKKKRKSSVESGNGAIEDQSKATKSCHEVLEDNVIAESETKAKKKKKTKHDLASPGETEEAKSDVPKKPVDDTMNGLGADDSNKKPKDKKRKSTLQDQQETCTKVNLPTSDTENGGVHPDVTKKEKKSFKKRKRLSSDESEHQSTETETIEESKRQKAETSKEDEVDGSDAKGASDKQLYKKK